MSETEEPPTKVLKINDEERALSDTTAVSNLTDASITTDTLDLPETALPVVTELPEITDLQQDSQEVADLPAQESLEMAENMAMEDMVEERLQESVESEEAGESQEEWLSEGLLTDDDFNPAVESAPDSQTSQPDTSTALDEGNMHSIPAAVESKPREQNIEDALNTLEGGPVKDEMCLDELLIRKTEIQQTKEVKNENVKQEVDDGNDTDDLLRMLGDDGSKTKKLTKTVKDVRSAVNRGSSDDDDFVYKGAAKKLKLSKPAGKVLPKAEPEDMAVSEQSSDESEMVQNMFVKKKAARTKPVRYQETQARSIVSVVERTRKDKLATSTPLPASRVRSLLKTPQTEHNNVQLKREPQHNTYSRKSQNKNAVPPKVSSILKVVKKKTEEGTVHEEFLDENFHLADEELESDCSEASRKPRLEKMEASDHSHSEDGSLYDELPSSESDETEDWFRLDLRAETAGDYLPLLGQKAKQQLLEEKKRVVARLANLKQSLSALTDSGKKLGAEVHAATIALAEVDDMLKAS